VFDETVSDNIQVGIDLPLGNEVISSLIAKVNGHDFYDPSDPESVGRKLGLKGANVSGGQRQRIAIARALARNSTKPKILILDEATASLDGKNEEEIQKIINQILEDKNCTIVVVAHRLSTIKNADVINVLGEGRVLERGSHEELLQLPNGV